MVVKIWTKVEDGALPEVHAWFMRDSFSIFLMVVITDGQRIGEKWCHALSTDGCKWFTVRLISQNAG